ncbi:hypothetical protein [Proteiniphilum acetatigenes]|uniref:hypothetical protein n=1 Tax=Proteiniphilum acetatigenes TaxID=294710 RepID=UPI00036E7F06|nr:hypothetical protein [Proteiniphilum acetatigenes]
MDWGNIITTIITTLIISGGSIFVFFKFLKQRTQKENSDVVDKDASAAKNMLEFADKFQDFAERQTNTYQKKLIELEIKVDEHSKKIKHLTLLLVGEQRKKQYAEKHICLVEDCNLRQPDKGTYKTDDAINKDETI